MNSRSQPRKGDKTMATIKIETGVPMPARQMKYPFADLKVGNSFFVKAKDSKSARTQAHTYKVKNPGWNFATRGVPGGVRIWRTD